MREDQCVHCGAPGPSCNTEQAKECPNNGPSNTLRDRDRDPEYLDEE